ncbi:uncharacterized protein LOC106468127 [Limulus polyphemus]|uniref:Uncharacterized protein LOC106468127 n=1 Tax=Limulus polyphemus TaxID=6850 RepID=A0ABM1T8D5_LIMPO|nr:uncharacterized protein LOC106468127 [Limulus polyphemus]
MLFIIVQSCGYPGSSAHSSVKFTTEVVDSGTEAIYSCDRGFELLGPSRKVCEENSTWTPLGIPFCVLNVAAGKAPMQSSIIGQGIPQKAIDGSTSTFFSAGTCTMTEAQSGKASWWYVNLLEPYMIQLVRVDFGISCCSNKRQATVVVRVGNNRPDLGVNPICSRFIGFIEEGRPLFFPCATAMPGAFVSIHLESPFNHPLSICEAFVYTDKALPIERCPSFRDQPLGSTATYSGKCYIFYNNQPMTFRDAHHFCAIRGGSLIDETNPALQGFLSWELYRRHRNDPTGQYWLGAVRDPKEHNTWKWINGKEVTTSFWNLPGSNENCSRFDGSKGWLWSDTNCDLNLNFICQHRPITCGKPERPTNSTILARSFEIGSVIEYRCSPGHLLVGPNIRTCLPTGVFSEFSPKCKYLECGPPATISHGGYKLVNRTRYYLSGVQYFCDEGYVLVGRGFLVCDVDERWNGPPPRCEPIQCSRPPGIVNGMLRMTTNTSIFGTIVEYICEPGYKLVGKAQLKCDSSGYWDEKAPVCEIITEKDVQVFSPSAPMPSIEQPPPKEITTQTTMRPTISHTFTTTRRPTSSTTSSTTTTRRPTSSTTSTTTTTTTRRPTSSTTSTTTTRKPTSSTTSTTTTTTRRPASSTTSTTTTRRPTSLSTSTTYSHKISTIPVSISPQFPLKPSLINRLQFGPIYPPWAITNRYPTAVSSTSTSSPSHLNRQFQHHIPPRTSTTKMPKVASSSEVPLITLKTKESKDQNTLYLQTVSPSGVKKSESQFGSKDEKSYAVSPKLNLGGIIALGGFGGFVFLSVIITIIVILVRRTRSKQNSKQSQDETTVSTFDGNGDHGLHRHYQRAWDNLHYSFQYHPHLQAVQHPVIRQETLENSNICNNGKGTVEGFREANEILVSDVAALYSQPEKKTKYSKHRSRSHQPKTFSTHEPHEVGTWYSHETCSRRSKY